MTKRVNTELDSYELILSGALANPAIIKAMAPLGYDRKAVLYGNNLLKLTISLQQSREQEENNQKESTQRLREAYQRAYKQYMIHLKVARMLISPNSLAWNEMKLGGTRKKNLAEWLVQAKAFYMHAGLVAEQLEQMGISPEELSQAEAMVEAITEARIEQNRCKSAKQMAKVRRDAERKALQKWMSKFMRAARFTFSEDIQQLEALGIVVPS